MSEKKTINLEGISSPDEFVKALERVVGEVTGTGPEVERLKDTKINADSCFGKSFEYVSAAVEIAKKAKIHARFTDALGALADEFNNHRENGIPAPCIRKIIDGFDAVIIALRHGTQLQPDKEQVKLFEDILNHVIVAHCYFHFALDNFRRHKDQKDPNKALWTPPTPKQ